MRSRDKVPEWSPGFESDERWGSRANHFVTVFVPGSGLFLDLFDIEIVSYYLPEPCTELQP